MTRGVVSKFRSLLLDVEERTITFPDGQSADWHVATYPGRATAVAVLGHLSATRELVMIRNYRPSLERWSLEVAGGLPMAGESVSHAAEREFREETGLDVRQLSAGPTLNSLPGLGCFPIACFIADAVEGESQTLDRNERITVLRIAAEAGAVREIKERILEPVSLALVDYFLRTRLESAPPPI